MSKEEPEAIFKKMPSRSNVDVFLSFRPPKEKDAKIGLLATSSDSDQEATDKVFNHAAKAVDSVLEERGYSSTYTAFDNQAFGFWRTKIEDFTPRDGEEILEEICQQAEEER